MCVKIEVSKIFNIMIVFLILKIKICGLFSMPWLESRPDRKYIDFLHRIIPAQPTPFPFSLGFMNATTRTLASSYFFLTKRGST